MEKARTSGEKQRSRSNTFWKFAVNPAPAGDEDAVRAEPARLETRHGGPDPVLTGFVGRGGNHPAAGAAAHHHRLAFQGRIEDALHGHVEGVHVDVQVEGHTVSVLCGQC